MGLIFAASLIVLVMISVVFNISATTLCLIVLAIAAALWIAAQVALLIIGFRLRRRYLQAMAQSRELDEAMRFQHAKDITQQAERI